MLQHSDRENSKSVFTYSTQSLFSGLLIELLILARCIFKYSDVSWPSQPCSRSLLRVLAIS